MVNLLRSSLGYADENSGCVFTSASYSDVASLFQNTVVEIWHDARNQVMEVGFWVLSTEVGLPVHEFGFHEGEFSQNFVQFCGSWLSQEEINDLSQYVANFNEATVFDIVVQLLQRPETIALVFREGGGHFDAAPHVDLPQRDNVLEFLRRAADRRRAAN
jgi:hypothetical protein